MTDKKRLIIIDANAVIHRAFHALPPLSGKDGKQTGAIYGFLLVYLKALKDFDPEYVVAAFDYPAPTFRHKKYKLYKATRERAPQELYDQIPKIKDFLKVFGIKVLEKKGFEADDIIGTAARLIQKKQIFPKPETIILTGDLDALQLVNENTKVYALRKGVKDTVLYDEEKVKEKLNGLRPDQVVDYKALRGDPSDNIPGVTGIGEKTAVELLLKYDSLDNLYENLKDNNEKIKASVKERLLAQKDQAYVSKMLAQINKDVPVNISFKDCRIKISNNKEVIKKLKDYEFNSLIDRLIKEEKKENLRLW